MSSLHQSLLLFYVSLTFGQSVVHSEWENQSHCIKQPAVTLVYFLLTAAAQTERS